MAGRGAAAGFGAAARQHGDLGAEVVAAPDGGVLELGVVAHVSLQVPPSPLSLDLGLNLSVEEAVKHRHHEALKGPQDQVENQPQLGLHLLRNECENNVIDPKQRDQEQR